MTGMRKLIGSAIALALAVGVATPAFAESFDTPPPGGFNWKVYDYNSSGKALSVRRPTPVTVGFDGGIAFDFLYTPDTALLITSHPSYRGDLLGDMTGKSVSAGVGVTVTPGTQFQYYGEPDGCGTPANVRLFFQTQTPGPFAETDYWWSNPVSATLDSLKAGEQTLTNPMQGAVWSDFYGHFGTGQYAAAFAAAVKNVKAIGLSFGGGCFFENGVGIVPGTGSGSFRLMDYSADPPGTVDLNVDVVPYLMLLPFTTPTLVQVP